MFLANTRHSLLHFVLLHALGYMILLLLSTTEHIECLIHDDLLTQTWLLLELPLIEHTPGVIQLSDIWNIFVGIEVITRN